MHPFVRVNACHSVIFFQCFALSSRPKGANRANPLDQCGMHGMHVAKLSKLGSQALKGTFDPFDSFVFMETPILRHKWNIYANCRQGCPVVRLASGKSMKFKETMTKGSKL